MPKKHSLIREALLAQAEAALEASLALGNDSKVMYGLWKALPSIILMPDAVYTRPYLSIDYDALFIYILKKDEQCDALRMMLSLIFSVSEKWQAEVHGDNILLFVPVQFGAYRLMLRILNVGKFDYKYEVVNTDEDGCKICNISDAKFVPFECLHDEITTTQFAQKVFEFGLNAKYSSIEGNILQALSESINPQVPVPDGIVVKMGMDFDVEFIYLEDTKAYYRKAISHLLGPCAWNGVWMKQQGEFGLHAIIPIDIVNNKLRLKVSILKARRGNEHLVYLGETQEFVLYRSLRPGDLNFEEFIKVNE